MTSVVFSGALSLTRCASNGEMRITLARLAASNAKMAKLNINSKYDLLSGHRIPALGYGVRIFASSYLSAI